MIKVWLPKKSFFLENYEANDDDFFKDLWNGGEEESVAVKIIIFLSEMMLVYPLFSRHFFPWQQVNLLKKWA